MNANKTKRESVETAARVLLLDVETSPNIAYVWGKYDQDALGDFIKERQIISFAWKWVGEKDVHVLALPSFSGYKKNPDNNRHLIIKLHEIMSKADIVVGHNIDAFDSPMSNTDFIVNRLKPLPQHKTVDTLMFARHKFRFNSNKLGDLGQRLGLGGKTKHWGFELWARCLRGDKKAWRLMMRYNRRDVELLEKVYLKLRPWMTRHPNMNAADKHIGCPRCRSTNRLSRGSWHKQGWGKIPRFSCEDCGHWYSGTVVKKEWRFA